MFPLYLTFSRIGLIPVIVGTYMSSWTWGPWVAAALFGLAAFTDWLDGFLARRNNQVSLFGGFLDPVADKLMVCAVLVVLVHVHHNFWVTSAALVIVLRELTVSALREWMAMQNLSAVTAVSWLGKIKTTLQMVAIPVLLLAGRGEGWLTLLGQAMLWLAALMTVASLAAYGYHAYRQMRQDGVV